MPFHPILPPEVRLRIYEICLDDYFDKTKSWIWVLPASASSSTNDRLTWADVHGATIKIPVPRILQVELGDMRARLLAWLSRRKGLTAMGNSPVLRFPDRSYQSWRDMLYLHTSTEIDSFCRLLGSNQSELADLAIIRRVAVAASVNHEEGIPRFLENFENLCPDLWDLFRLDELLVVFMILEQGKLVDVTSTWKGNHSAYSIEPLQEADFEGRKDGLQRAVKALDKLVKPMLLAPYHEELRITACKMIPRT